MPVGQKLPGDCSRIPMQDCNVVMFRINVYIPDSQCKFLQSLLPSTPGCLSLMCLLSMLVTMVLLKLITSSYSTHKLLSLNLPTLLAAGIGTTERECVCVCVCMCVCVNECVNASKIIVCTVVITYKAMAQANVGFCPFQPIMHWK